MALNLGFAKTVTSDTDDHGVGVVHWDGDGKAYRWVQFVDQDAAVGEVVYPANTSGTQVTTDYTGGSGLSAKVAGIALGTVDISVASYAWVQVSGNATVRGDGSVAAGDAVIGHTVDGEADTFAAGEEHLVFGYSLAADGGSPVTFACQLHGIL